MSRAIPTLLQYVGSVTGISGHPLTPLISKGCKTGFRELSKSLFNVFNGLQKFCPGVAGSVMVCMLFLASFAHAQSPTLAFPGAEGFGRFAKGGRGGRICEVTNRNDSGPGSFRACAEAQGPRIVVFRVGGTIDLRGPVVIQNPFLTIAGQTAPGDGIQIKGGGIILRNVDDVIVRYLRVRPGPNVANPSTSNAFMVLGRSTNVIVDRSSFSWATDQNTAIWDEPRNVTFQWNIISEALHCSRHAEGCHSKGLLIGYAGTSDLSVHHNLFAHNVTRNPWIKRGAVDLVNNVIYGFRDIGIHLSASEGPLQVNVVGNRYIKSPDSNVKGIRADGRLSNSGYLSQSDVYLKGNIIPWYRPTDDLPDQKAIEWVSWTDTAFTDTPHPFPKVSTTDAFQATTDVLANAGARLPAIDPVDQRIIQDVHNALAGKPTGGIINDPSEVGGWPALASVSRPSAYDTDQDGMPNSWENLHRLNPNSPNDGPLDADGDGWTNVEEFLNGTNPRDGLAFIAPPVNFRIIR